MENTPPPPPELPPLSPAPSLVTPSNLTQDEKNFALFAHIGGLVGSLVGGGALAWLAPLIIYLMKKDQSAFVAMHARKALVVSIATTVLLIICLIGFICLSWIVVGLIFIPLGLLVWIGYVVFCVYEAVQAAGGKPGISIPF